jgi:hypothetical protein
MKTCFMVLKQCFFTQSIIAILMHHFFRFSYVMLKCFLSIVTHKFYSFLNNSITPMIMDLKSKVKLIESLIMKASRNNIIPWGSLFKSPIQARDIEGLKRSALVANAPQKKLNHPLLCKHTIKLKQLSTECKRNIIVE